MPFLKTRHSVDFDPSCDPLDRSRSPYTESFNDYSDKCAVLASLVGADSFLWCYPVEHSFRSYESVKPVEWIINVSDKRVLGFVDDERWCQYLEDGNYLPQSVFSTSGSPAKECSILVSFPLNKEELISKTVFQFISSTKAKIVSKEDF